MKPNNVTEQLLKDRAELIERIRSACNKINAPFGVMLIVSAIESSITASCNQGSAYVGLLQLSNGYGGCNGEERCNVEHAIRCTWQQMQSHKASWIKEFPNSKWNDFYYYLCHQQGLTGAKQIYSGYLKAQKISDLPSARQNAMVSNSYKEWEIAKSDLISKWFASWKGIWEAFDIKFGLVTKIDEKQVLSNPLVPTPLKSNKALVLIGTLGVCGLIAYSIYRKKNRLSDVALDMFTDDYIPLAKLREVKRREISDYQNIAKIKFSLADRDITKTYLKSNCKGRRGISISTEITYTRSSAMHTKGVYYRSAAIDTDYHDAMGELGDIANGIYKGNKVIGDRSNKAISIARWIDRWVTHIDEASGIQLFPAISGKECKTTKIKAVIPQDYGMFKADLFGTGKKKTRRKNRE